MTQDIHGFDIRLMDAMTRMGVSQATLSNISGSSPSMISYYCSGQRLPTLPVAQKIAAALNTTVDYLVGGIGNIHNKPQEIMHRDTFTHDDTLEVARAYDALPDVTERNYVRRALRLPELGAEVSYELTLNNKKHA